MSGELLSFRDEVRTWLRDNVPERPLAPVTTERGFAEHREWERRLAAAGLAAVHWPVEHGGRGLDALSASVFYDEYVRAGAPDRLGRLGLGLVGPTLMEWGTPRQRELLPAMLTCDDIWCQGFSEPDAGSDLASLRTRGEVGTDSIRINGQKVWTSHFRFATWIFALVRTDPEAPKHRGISYVLIPCDTPGVEFRPIRQMNDDAEFAELFLTDVEVPLENVVGGLGNGWKVAMSTLTHERSSNLNTAAHFHRVLRDAVALIPEARRNDSLVRYEVGRFHEEIEAYRFMTLRTLTEVSKGEKPGPQASMGKVWWSELQTRILEFALSMLASEAEVRSGGLPGATNLFKHYWMSRASHIYAGSNEIQRNIIAERVLGLPRSA
ncbi:acyl-CoA dehydrogenase family protein [Actinomadura welshii]